MYTQCPDCSTAFRVTADLLQQAAGRVRCGSCGHAFNALEHLSENPPPVVDPPATAQDGDDDDQNALIDTFTDLSAFDDIRIEDTGVEWRVIDNDDMDEASAADERENAGSGSVHWYLAEEDDEPPAGDGAPLPEVIDEVPVGDWPVADDTGGIIVEESAIHEPQEPLDLRGGDPSQRRYDDNTPLPDDFDDGLQSAAAEGAPRRRATDRIEPRPAEFDERQVDLALGEPEDWRELLDEFGTETEQITAAAEPADEHVSEGADRPTRDDTADTDIRLFGESDDDAEDAALDFDLQADAGGDAARPLIDFDPGADEAAAVDFAVRAAGDDSGVAAVDFDPGDGRGASDDAFEFAKAFAGEESTAGIEDREQREREAALGAELAAAYAADDEQPAAPADGGGREADYEIPQQTEEEMTINMQIDQDLMRLAAEEGFISILTGERKMPDDSLLVETIVMEGDFVRSALDRELDAVVETVAGKDDDPRLLLDTYIKSKEPIRGGRRRTDPPSYTVIAGLIVLGIVLLAQVVHAYRETLATYGAFNHTVGSVYRLFGDPLVPDWNVRGWRFESTSGSTDAADEVLTIRSRITNRSAQALPYPLLHVALTDRFEEIIGSRVLEPAEYLTDGPDPALPVASEAGFTAVITVESLSSEATGFKLNVCYREDTERLRCATEDFRN